ncbi:uncharacterized protein LOC129304841 isoform X1 [Prosopis cineraria]|uniref:uncharacterized protein LOC129304841 isoform X1 n=2 Tax=Prosopis cineraria TaxID=364024 RepID=UPI00240FBDD5|nr:uncharacterized protein LOC129304841 isoform X1 [Prosopis cineraria]
MDLAIQTRRSALLNPFFFASFFLLFCIFITTDASIHFYDKEPFREIGNAYLLAGGNEGILASLTATSLSDMRIHDGRSYIRFENITFQRSKAAAAENQPMEYSTGLIQVVIFEAADRNNIGGSAYGGQRAICCTPDLAKLEGCEQGQVIRRHSVTDVNWPIILNVRFSGRYLIAKLDDDEVSITKTGMYNLFFVVCDPKLNETVMSGKTIWKNPDGYLPGRMAPLKNFYIFMAVAYLCLSMIWFLQYLRFWKDILNLQHCITAIIALGLFEMILWHFEYFNFNDTGIRPVVVTTWVVTVGAIRKTISRLIILSVSMGYGVVRPTLGGLTSKVLLLGITYFLASELLDITEYVGTINDISGRARLLLVLPNAFLNAFIIVWIFTSLSRTLEQLQAKRSSVKLDIYRKFSNALAVTVICSVAWIVYEVYFKATDPFNERWQNAWFITAFWDILAFALLCVICYLWAPSQSSQRYAYSDEVGEESDDEEAQSLTNGKPQSELSLAEQEKNVADDNASLDLENDPEEGKRE